ncbi:hypothetical protein [Gemella morbillorum]
MEKKDKTVWLKRIEESKNIDKLPSFEELEGLINKDSSIYEELDKLIDKEIVIADGTKITIVRNGISCYSNDESFEYYKVIDKDLYICMDCGLKQRAYEDIKNKIGYDSSMELELLPLDWSISDVEDYFKKKEKNQ